MVVRRRDPLCEKTGKKRGGLLLEELCGRTFSLSGGTRRLICMVKSPLCHMGTHEQPQVEVDCQLLFLTLVKTRVSSFGSKTRTLEVTKYEKVVRYVEIWFLLDLAGLGAGCVSLL